MEQSSISTNVNIDFQKKVQSTPTKRVQKPRTPIRRAPAPATQGDTFDPKGEIPVRI
ncbi:MAG: hypothetical protein WCJ81_02930 [bacterium]